MSLVRSSALTGYLELVAELGGDGVARLERAGIPPAAVDDPQAFVPYPALIHVFERTAEELACPDLGLRLALRQDLGILGPVGVAVRNCETVGEAMACASRYMHVHSPAIAFAMRPDADDDRRVCVEFRILLDRIGPAIQVVELSVALAARTLALLVDQPGVLRGVRFAHPRHAPLARYREHFRAPIAFEAGASGLVIDADDLALPIRAASRPLQRLAEDYLRLRYERADLPLATRVRMAIERSLGTGASGCRDVAAALALHPRTLQRLLRAEGTSFEALKDAARAELARRYLAHPTLPIGRIASLLDYTEQSALTRSCRRWFGRSPRQLRSARRSVPPSRLADPRDAP